MKKMMSLLAFFCAFPLSYAHAYEIAGDIVETAQPVAEDSIAHVRLGDLVDTGINISLAEIAPQQVASLEIGVPGPSCRIYETRASFYSSGSKVAYNDQRFYPNGISLATRHLELNSTVWVKIRGSDQWIKGVANDRGPFVYSRGADLSLGYAKAVHFPLGAGVAKIQMAACGGGQIDPINSTPRKKKS